MAHAWVFKGHRMPYKASLRQENPAHFCRTCTEFTREISPKSRSQDYCSQGPGHCKQRPLRLSITVPSPIYKVPRSWTTDFYTSLLKKKRKQGNSQSAPWRLMHCSSVPSPWELKKGIHPAFQPAHANALQPEKPYKMLLNQSQQPPATLLLTARDCSAVPGTSFCFHLIRRHAIHSALISFTVWHKALITTACFSHNTTPLQMLNPCRCQAHVSCWCCKSSITSQQHNA